MFQVMHTFCHRGNIAPEIKHVGSQPGSDRLWSSAIECGFTHSVYKILRRSKHPCGTQHSQWGPLPFLFSADEFFKAQDQAFVTIPA
jgi:hypothetical protein